MSLTNRIERQQQVAGADDDLKAEIKTLQERLGQMRRERVVVQRRVASRAGVEASVQRAHRERSTRTSPEANQLRERAESLVDELLATLRGDDRVQHLYLMAVTSQFLQRDGSFEESAERDHALRGRLRQEFAERDIRVAIPGGPSTDWTELRSRSDATATPNTGSAASTANDAKENN